MDGKRIQEIKDRCDKAISGEWVSKKFGGYHSIYKGPVKVQGCGMHHGGSICQMEDPCVSDFSRKQINDTAEFMAHSITDIPYLLSVIESLSANAALGVAACKAADILGGTAPCGIHALANTDWDTECVDEDAMPCKWQDFCRLRAGKGGA